MNEICSFDRMFLLLLFCEIPQKKVDDQAGQTMTQAVLHFNGANGKAQNVLELLPQASRTSADVKVCGLPDFFFFLFPADWKQFNVCSKQ